MGAIVAGFASPSLAGFSAGVPNLLPAGPRTLILRSIHTGEHLSATYWRDGGYVAPVLRQLDHLLRDHRTGELHPIAPSLMDVLFLVRHRLGSDAAFDVISGYRSPRTNANLAAASTGVAKQSMHVEGKAIDVHLAGRSIAALGEAGKALRIGGVGRYRDFVHFDVGRSRDW